MTDNITAQFRLDNCLESDLPLCEKILLNRANPSLLLDRTSRSQYHTTWRVGIKIAQLCVRLFFEAVGRVGLGGWKGGMTGTVRVCGCVNGEGESNPVRTRFSFGSNFVVIVLGGFFNAGLKHYL